MTDTLIQTLEEKIMMLLTEMDDLRFEVQHLKQENANFKAEKANYTQKLQGLIAMLDSAEMTAQVIAPAEMNAFELEAI